MGNLDRLHLFGNASLWCNLLNFCSYIGTCLVLYIQTFSHIWWLLSFLVLVLALCFTVQLFRSFFIAIVYCVHSKVSIAALDLGIVTLWFDTKLTILSKVVDLTMNERSFPCLADRDICWHWHIIMAHTWSSWSQSSGDLIPVITNDDHLRCVTWSSTTLRVHHHRIGPTPLLRFLHELGIFIMHIHVAI